MLRANDLPPKYEDLQGCENLGSIDDQDNYLPKYSECVNQPVQSYYGLNCDWPQEHENVRPGRY